MDSYLFENNNSAKCKKILSEIEHNDFLHKAVNSIFVKFLNPRRHFRIQIYQIWVLFQYKPLMMTHHYYFLSQLTVYRQHRPLLRHQVFVEGRLVDLRQYASRLRLTKLN